MRREHNENVAYKQWSDFACWFVERSLQRTIGDMNDWRKRKREIIFLLSGEFYEIVARLQYRKHKWRNPTAIVEVSGV